MDGRGGSGVGRAIAIGRRVMMVQVYIKQSVYSREGDASESHARLAVSLL